MYILLLRPEDILTNATVHGIDRWKVWRLPTCIVVWITFSVTAAWNGATLLSNCNSIGILAEKPRDVTWRMNTSLKPVYINYYVMDLFTDCWLDGRPDVGVSGLWVQRSHCYVSFIQVSLCMQHDYLCSLFFCHWIWIYFYCVMYKDIFVIAGRKDERNDEGKAWMNKIHFLTSCSITKASAYLSPNTGLE